MSRHFQIPISLLAGATAFLPSVAGEGPSLDAIVAGNLESRGGAANVESLETVRFRMDRCLIEWALPDTTRIECPDPKPSAEHGTMVDGVAVPQTFIRKGQRAWSPNWLEGTWEEAPRDWSFAVSFLCNMDLALLPLQDYRGGSELLGRAELNARGADRAAGRDFVQAFKIRRSVCGSTGHLYLHPEHHLVLKAETTVFDRPRVVRYQEYRDMYGVLVPTEVIFGGSSFAIRPGVQFPDTDVDAPGKVLHAFEFNVEIPASRFDTSVDPRAGIQGLEHLVGTRPEQKKKGFFKKLKDTIKGR